MNKWNTREPVSKILAIVDIVYRLTLEITEEAIKNGQFRYENVYLCIRYWNCSDIVVFFVFHLIAFSIPWLPFVKSYSYTLVHCNIFTNQTPIHNDVRETY
jgi:hypothetical protein